jgi:hypothetical protein
MPPRLWVMAFGTAVAIFGSLMVVGAPLEDSGANDVGRVYVA